MRTLQRGKTSIRRWLKRHRLTRELHDHLASHERGPFKQWKSWDDEDTWASNL